MPSSSLLPKDDPSVLLTTAGMQQFKPYYTGEKDPIKDFGARRVASIQKSFRTSDIDSVGDESHLTFFEMLGNFSFGDYFKEDAIKWAWELITRELKISPERCYVSVFNGDNEVPEDKESIEIWRSLGLPDNKIKKCGREDNFWGPTGNEGPCGPTSEIYVDNIEIWNLVFNEYYCNSDKTLTPLKQKGVDTGMGLERLAMVVQNKSNIFETDLFSSLIQALPTADTDVHRKRIIVDHARASFFLVCDGVKPSNKEQGYILRRLLRRMTVQAHLGSRGSFSGTDTLSLGAAEDIKNVFNKIKAVYESLYQELDLNAIIGVFDDEFGKFNKVFRFGLREIKRLENIDALTAFKLYESFGLTYEIIKDIGGDKAIKLSRDEFDVEFKKHQEISRAGAEKKFGGHGISQAKNSEDVNKITRLHTATHLLHQALHDVLGSETKVQQMGSDITAKRARFDFSFPRKLAPEEIKKIEDIVNEKIKMDLPVYNKKISKEDALIIGARAFFKDKYPDEVNVYSIGDPDPSKAYSKELCAGPHVGSTGQIGHFKIIKEESSSAGVRRIRATVE